MSESIKSTRKTFSTTIAEDISSNFRDACTESGIGMNIVLEVLMQSFIDNKFILTLKDGKFSLDVKR